MKKGWEKVRLGEVTEIVMGQSPKSEFYNTFGEGLPFFQGCSDFGELYPSPKTYCTKILRVAEKDDVLMSVRAPVGDLNIAKEKCIIGRGLCALQTKLKNGRFLYYLIKSNVSKLISLETGAVYGAVNKTTIENLELKIPSLITTQRKIASILSAYDDLIENNNRRISILEDMAQTIYREWFVNFRFPGHEKIKMIDSELGKIPEGWEVKKLGNVATLHRGKSYRTTDLTDEGGLPFLNLKCIKRGGGFRYDGVKWYKGEYKEAQTAKTGDIIVAVTDMTQERRIVAHTARVHIIEHDFAVMSMDLVKVEPNVEIAKDYLHGLLRFSDFSQEVKQHANGVNVLHLNPKQIEEFKFALPFSKLRNHYAEFCDTIYKECDLLHAKNVFLRRTRDLLLPKLISGEIEVENIEIKTKSGDII